MRTRDIERLLRITLPVAAALAGIALRNVKYPDHRQPAAQQPPAPQPAARKTNAYGDPVFDDDLLEK